jgi:hypothetical protein
MEDMKEELIDLEVDGLIDDYELLQRTKEEKQRKGGTVAVSVSIGSIVIIL